MNIIGLTGGIGCGKSAAAAYFREAGVPVIDADAAGHELLESDANLRAAVVGSFGGDIIGQDGALSREKLAARVFTDPDARRRLNALLHPAIIAEVGRRCAALNEAGHESVIVEAALIGEGGRRDPWLSGIILVLAEEQIRMERLMRYRQFTREEAQRRMAAQTPPETKAAFADWIIDNNADRDGLRLQVMKIADAIRARKLLF